ncbi:MAG: hypothetical protein M5U26_08035 [Planctomycetota bacterium]|nr:hypothetical protein [Planctomycetota bacterium]
MELTHWAWVCLAILGLSVLGPDAACAEDAPKPDPIQRLAAELEAQALRAAREDDRKAEREASARSESAKAGGEAWKKEAAEAAKAREKERREAEKRLAKERDEARKQAEKAEKERRKREAEYAERAERSEYRESGYGATMGGEREGHARGGVYVGGAYVQEGGWTELGGVSRSSRYGSGSPGGYLNESGGSSTSIGVRATVIRLDD